MRGATVTKAFIFTCIGAYMLQLIVRAAAGEPLIMQWFALNPPDVLHGHLYQLFTHAILHDSSSFFHIFFNLLVIYFFAPHIERHWGSKRFLIFLLFSILIPGLVALLFYNVRVLGASGVDFAVLVAYGCLWPKRKILFVIIPMPGIVAIMILVGFEFYYIFQQAIGVESGIAHFAHIAGAAVGFGAVMFVPNVYWQIKSSLAKRRAARTGNEEERADELFRKISRFGLSSLSDAERKFLDDYSAKKRN